MPPSIKTRRVYGFLFVVAQAVAEGIYVLMDIEDNTRRAASARENRSEGA